MAKKTEKTQDQTQTQAQEQAQDLKVFGAVQYSRFYGKHVLAMNRRLKGYEFRSLIDAVEQIRSAEGVEENVGFVRPNELESTETSIYEMTPHGAVLVGRAKRPGKSRNWLNWLSPNNRPRFSNKDDSSENTGDQAASG